MIRKFRFKGGDVLRDLKESYGFTGDLAELYATQTGPVVHKWHHYLPIYDRYLQGYRGTDVRMLEIGVSRGGSLELWRRYFVPDASLFGIDINPDCARFDGNAGQVRIGSQDDPGFLSAVVEEMGGIDVVLDDGSHMMNHIRTSLETLFPMLSDQGLYMIEDLHTAYWPSYGGGLEAQGNFFQDLGDIFDDMHHWYHDAPSRARIDGKTVGAVHVHDSLVVVEKALPVRPRHSRVGGPSPASDDT